jgi:hypothetical protein
MPSTTTTITTARISVVLTSARSAPTPAARWSVLPALHLVGPARASRRPAPARPDVDQRQVQAGGAAGQADQALRGAQRHDRRAAVELAHAQVHQRGDAQRVADAGAAPVTSVKRSPTPHAQVAASSRPTMASPGPSRAAGHHLAAQAHDAVVAVELDAHQRDRARGLAALRQPGAATIGDTAATRGGASSVGTSACQLAMERGRCARGCVCCRAVAAGAGGSTAAARVVSGLMRDVGLRAQRLVQRVAAAAR